MTKAKLIEVKIIAKTDVHPIDLASHAALECYQAKAPEIGKKINVENRLFTVGHHTTLQHYFFTFNVENISVGDVTAGLHLVNPFYNSDQRSGRYCANMFLNPDYKNIEAYIDKYWPKIDGTWKKQVISYVKKGVSIFHDNIGEATLATRRILKEERPFANDRYLDMNAPKIAQEQMRMFIPVIFPTGLDFTVNLTALSALYISAWTPAMKKLTEQMANAVINVFPELKFMFNPQSRRERKWTLEIKNGGSVLKEPKLELISIDNEEGFIYLGEDDMHPVDLLHFMPEYMDNSLRDIETKIELSLATMGQDQRHRAIRRGKPSFTGNFYLPAVPQECGLFPEAENLLNTWKNFRGNIPDTLFTILAPYGAMVKYVKKGSFNAVAHEQAKRLCFCAQEEIYNLGRLLREAIKKRKTNNQFLKILKPPCYKAGICAEGARYCGRDIKSRIGKNYFPKRRV